MAESVAICAALDGSVLTSTNGLPRQTEEGRQRNWRSPMAIDSLLIRDAGARNTKPGTLGPTPNGSQLVGLGAAIW